MTEMIKGALLPIVIVAGVILLAVSVLLWVRNRRGRAVQWFGLALLPIGLYLTGVLTLLVDGARELIRWIQQQSGTTVVWIGVGLIVLFVLLWLIGGRVAIRNLSNRAVARNEGGVGNPLIDSGPKPRKEKPAKQARAEKQSRAEKQAVGSDDGMDEIEALLKKRGIE